MKHFVVLIVLAFFCGAEANTYTTRAALRIAVDSCLSNDATGQSCNMNSWDVSQVTDMQDMFWNKGNFNADISAWDTSSVTSMYRMFSMATAFNADISAWNTSSVTTTFFMFYQARAFNADISAWDTSSVMSMRGMFREAISFNADITGWDTSSLTNSGDMFRSATAWLASYIRTPSGTDGPPDAWATPPLRPCTCCERKLKSYGFSVGSDDCDPDL